MSASEMKLNLAKPGIDAEADAYRASRRRSLWRSRSLPALGILGIVAAWWAVVAIFDVKPFIAPTPGLVLQTLYDKRDILLQNLMPTAVEAAGDSCSAICWRRCWRRCSCTARRCGRFSIRSPA